MRTVELDCEMRDPQVPATTCHCGRAPLTLDGRWHLEHMPKGVGGEEEPGNSVAACEPSKPAKRNRAALGLASSRFGVQVDARP